ncbi:6(G)-fructosyltransferase-like [Malania oleifera]|uniref:6(G)-fructosyltransferase-like n=1 Tax=Malania oleifera TaxID=397392 RepID=UPI0025AE9672|nr:6(G)-fructosyltransferase-like [Malania oleifera]
MYYKGIYHLFYQYSLKGAVWDNIVWTYSVSKDPLNWVALDPTVYLSKSFDINGCWYGVVLDLPILGVESGVEDDRFVTREDGGRSEPTPIYVEGLGWVDDRVKGDLADEVLGDGVNPNDVAPHNSLRAVLVEEMIDSIVVHWSYFVRKKSRIVGK